jgi:hypothetical protein
MLTITTIEQQQQQQQLSCRLVLSFSTSAHGALGVAADVFVVKV